VATTFDPNRLSRALRALEAALPGDPRKADLPRLGKAQGGHLLQAISVAVGSLEAISERLDPIRPPPFVLDPTDPKTTGMLIGKLLEELEPVGLDKLGMFYGSGVYAIYFLGDFPAYLAIRGTLCPIYVGKADPSNPKAKTPKEQSPRVCVRLQEHAKSSRIPGILEVLDFVSRYLETNCPFHTSMGKLTA
jgi:hypothetical protein